ncbi:hypothetical protein [Mesorhizobium sp. CN2-181]|uniref:DUF768 domain-containing protein n=1 Tax=Mesorhizobium yinganensis TaxID=3157707 RepID=UPI0032B764E0
MSARGLQFLNKWIAKNIPADAKADSVLASELADKVLVAAEKEGLTAKDVGEEVDSIFETILKALKDRAGGSPE